MSLLNDLAKKAEGLGLDDKIKEATGLDIKDLDLKDIDPEKIQKVKDLAAKAIGKVDIAGIAKKVGIPENLVKKILNKG